MNDPDAIVIFNDHSSEQMKCTCGKQNDPICVHNNCGSCCEEKDCTRHVSDVEDVVGTIPPQQSDQKFCGTCEEEKYYVCDECNIDLCGRCDRCASYYKKCESGSCEQCSDSRSGGQNCPNKISISGIICIKCFDADKWN